MPRHIEFPEPVLDALGSAKILGVRSGSEHRYTGVWLVVVEDRLFVRSWNDAPGGWLAAFRAEPIGSIQVADQEIAVRGLLVRSGRIRNAVTDAYATKYHTKGSQKWVSGFAEPERLKNTLELAPLE